MLSTKRLVIIALALLSIIYIKHYSRPSKGFDILQLSVEQIQPSHLLEKSPIVFNERVVHPDHMIKTIFKYLYLFKRIEAPRVNDQQFRQSKSRYKVIFSSSDDTHVHIGHPLHMKDNVSFIDVVLPTDMCIVIPYKWHFRVTGEKAPTVYGLYDLFSILSYF